MLQMAGLDIIFLIQNTTPYGTQAGRGEDVCELVLDARTMSRAYGTTAIFLGKLP